MSKTEFIYAARDTSTGKLVSDITNPRRKYWDKKGNAVSAIEHYNEAYANGKRRSRNKGEHGTLELVTFRLVEAEAEWLSAYDHAVLHGETREEVLAEYKLDTKWKFCSNCGQQTKFRRNFCPNCGAKMKGE